MDELKPCPFCGKEASGGGIRRWSSNPNTHWADTGEEVLEAFFANCMSCGTHTADHRTREKAVAAWNARVPSPVPAPEPGSKSKHYESKRSQYMLPPPGDTLIDEFCPSGLPDDPVELKRMVAASMTAFWQADEAYMELRAPSPVPAPELVLAEALKRIERLTHPKLYVGNHYATVELPGRCPECDGQSWISHGVNAMICHVCWLTAELDRVEQNSEPVQALIEALKAVEADHIAMGALSPETIELARAALALAEESK